MSACTHACMHACNALYRCRCRCRCRYTFCIIHCAWYTIHEALHTIHYTPYIIVIQHTSYIVHIHIHIHLQQINTHLVTVFDTYISIHVFVVSILNWHTLPEYGRKNQEKIWASCNLQSRHLPQLQHLKESRTKHHPQDTWTRYPAGGCGDWIPVNRNREWLGWFV